jgi:Fe-Mn family superoxide dismutase
MIASGLKVGLQSVKNVGENIGSFVQGAKRQVETSIGRKAGGSVEGEKLQPGNRGIFGLIGEGAKVFNSALDKTEGFLNNLIPGTEFESASLEEIVKKSSGGVFNNAAQVWNHTFYWNSMSPNGGGEPVGALADAIHKTFGGLEGEKGLKAHFKTAATGRFGSGWAWLVVKADKSIAVTSTPNQDSPLMKGIADVNGHPVLALDVWEHAYYLKYQNRRPDYIDAFWKVIDWKKANELYVKAIG